MQPKLKVMKLKPSLGAYLIQQRNGLTLSLPILLRLYTFPYWSNPLFLIFNIRALRCITLTVEVAHS